MRHLILRLNREKGMTVLLSSHQLSEVEQLCSRIAILNQGRLVFQGPWSELRSDRKRFRLEIDDWAKAAPVIAGCGGTVQEKQIVELAPGRDPADLVAALVQAGVRIGAVEPLRQTLEELYLGTIAKP
jgi:ABC-2 type transport system ATP-binding protein